MKRLILAVPLLAMCLCATGCLSAGGQPPDLTDQQVCLAHNENDPVLRAQCVVDARSRNDTPPDADPHQLPIQTDDLGKH